MTLPRAEYVADMIDDIRIEYDASVPRSQIKPVVELLTEVGGLVSLGITRKMAGASGHCIIVKLRKGADAAAVGAAIKKIVNPKRAITIGNWRQTVRQRPNGEFVFERPICTLLPGFEPDDSQKFTLECLAKVKQLLSDRQVLCLHDMEGVFFEVIAAMGATCRSVVFSGNLSESCRHTIE